METGTLTLMQQNERNLDTNVFKTNGITNPRRNSRPRARDKYSLFSFALLWLIHVIWTTVKSADFPMMKKVLFSTLLSTINVAFALHITPLIKTEITVTPNQLKTNKHSKWNWNKIESKMQNLSTICTVTVLSRSFVLPEQPGPVESWTPSDPWRCAAASAPTC